MSTLKFRYKKWVILAQLLMFLLILGCTGNASKENKTVGVDRLESVKSGKYPKFEFSKEIHKFGKISEGEIGVCDFYFKNVGGGNLIIKSVESDCGCANFKWTKKPIKVGEESKITIEFNSKGRHGKQYKVITIFSNTLQKKKKLIITASVE
ncbi:DUF1573 domain-containing protein [Marinifilum sp. D737]|uniref:DUF1573 domain-containing protein n=1 Tax=Marinifilum sp. D737 TaxID=2969628 RepID=UPI0022752C11|nr:DUF1573 domain-containing protein [Marinifilum sp. D737]MCY1635290.1 DUF1573 domain-containing protein [Marinifilum sp. D737]